MDSIIKRIPKVGKLSATLMSCRHVFGLKGDVTNNVFHLDDSTIVYPAGNFVVIYSIDSKTQTLIPCSAVCVSSRLFQFSTVRIANPR